MITPLEQSILGALVYFDIFEYPLTLLEIQRYLLRVGLPAESAGANKQYTLSQINQALSTSAVLVKAARFKNGFYYLRGREANLRTRAERYGLAAAKYRRVKKVARLLSYLPFVRLIVVCNSLSISAGRQASDIDLFVVARAGGVWWARLFALAILKLLRSRPGQNGIKDKICLSFFVDEARLNLAPVRLGEWDVYLAYWLAALYPVYEAGDWYGRLWRANDWLGAFLPQARPVLAHWRRYFVRRALVRPALETGLAPFTGLVSSLQQRLFPAAIKNMANIDSRVRVEPGILKFHTNDRRLDYNQEFSKRFKAVSTGLL